MLYRVLVFLFIAVFVPVSVAQSEPLRLLCEGVMPTYSDGFGTTKIDWGTKSSRLIEIDTQGQLVNIQTLFGTKTAALSTADDTYFSFAVKHGAEWQGKVVVEEQVTINRYTGEVFSLYTVAPISGVGSNRHLAFDGKCQKAQRRF